MPIYEFRCRGCGLEFELIELPGRQSPTKCPECNCYDLDRLISTFSTPRQPAAASGQTCCGREERCSSPPCDTNGSCAKR